MFNKVFFTFGATWLSCAMGSRMVVVVGLGVVEGGASAPTLPEEGDSLMPYSWNGGILIINLKY